MQNEGLSLEQKKEVKETFNILTEKEPDHKLKTKDIKLAMMGLGLSPSNDEISRIITQLKLFKKLKPEEELLSISYEEFYDIVHFRLLNKKFSFQNETKKMFNLLTNGKDTMIKEDIFDLGKKFDVKNEESEFEKIYEVSDINKDKKITLEDFQKILKNTNYL